jgi:hypothetical protein
MSRGLTLEQAKRVADMEELRQKAKREKKK